MRREGCTGVPKEFKKKCKKEKKKNKRIVEADFRSTVYFS
jgi:hypothetical protein